MNIKIYTDEDYRENTLKQLKGGKKANGNKKRKH